MCSNDPVKLMTSGAQIIQRMGKFDHIKNVLKQNARKGQLFSICKHICDLEPG